MAGPPPDVDVRRERTLRLALALSAWGPLATGVAVLLSHSSTQMADFLRRSAELLAIALAWGVARRLRQRGVDADARRRLERATAWAVAGALLLSGGVTLVVAGGRWLSGLEPGGDVRLGLLVALLGLGVNAGFWRRYAALGRERAGALLDGQRRLYRAKVVVDAGVALALATVALAPGSLLARGTDVSGSVLVGLYLMWSGGRTLCADGRWAAAHGGGLGDRDRG